MVPFDCRSGQAEAHHERLVNTVASDRLKLSTNGFDSMPFMVRRAHHERGKLSTNGFVQEPFALSPVEGRAVVLMCWSKGGRG